VLALMAAAVAAGVIAGISPCVLPVLPVVLAAGASDGPAAGPAPLGRAVSVALGLAVSFALFTLAGSALLAALGLPQDLIRIAGIVALAAVGVGLAVPRLGSALERPFAALRLPPPSGRARGFALGLALGAVYVPCAGPVLAAISVIAATHRIGPEGILVTALFAAGTAAPLVVVALAGQGLRARVHALRVHAAAVRATAGAVLVAMAVLIATGVTNGLAVAVPAYTGALQTAVETGPAVRQALAAMDGEGRAPPAAHAARDGTLGDCTPDASRLAMCGAAPAFVGIARWLNTPGGRALTIAGLRGRVVLVDFWTYSCINCERALPHVEAWYRRYRAAGLTVVGVHTPEFAFEHVVSNVRTAARALGVTYPIAVDNRYATWNAYANAYWPADYLIDAQGVVRAVSYGEGGYGRTETLIRTLLRQADPGRSLPARTDVPDRTPRETTSPETYLGYGRAANMYQMLVPNRATRYAMPSQLGPGVAVGGVWTARAQELTSGPGARLALNFQAEDVYLVAGGHGTIRVRLGAGPARTVVVAGIPRLYTLVRGSVLRNGIVHLRLTPGIRAYDITFG